MQLEEICEFIVDCPHSTAKDEGRGYPLIRTPNIGKGRLLLENVYRVSEQVYKERTQRAVPENGDIIFAREAPAGNAALITNNEQVCLGQRTVLIRPNKEVVNPNFLVYYLLAPEQQYKLLGNAHGATVDHVNLPIIRKMPVQLPERNKQDKIADILSAYDDLIENNKKQIKLLEEAAQRLYKEWFVDLRFPGYENTKIIDGVPEGWKSGILNDIADNVGKKEKKENRGRYTCYLPIDCLPKYSLAYIEENDIHLAESSLVTFKTEDILFGAMRPYFHKVVVARTDGVTRSTCFVVNSKDKRYWSFLIMLLFSKETIGYATKISVGTTMPYIRWIDFVKMPVVIPKKDISEQFNDSVAPLIKKIMVLADQIVNLQQARNRILPKLMNGEVEF